MCFSAGLSLSHLMKKLLFVLAFTLALLLLASGGKLSAATLKSEALFTVSAQQFQSGGRAIRADHLEPTAAGPHRAILVLYGSGGMIFDGPEMQRVAASLARAGNAVYVVHYFDRTGTLAARDGVMQENFESWLGTVRDAIGWVQSERKSAQPVGIYGYSLGAFLAVAAASNDPRVGAVAEQAGGVWNGNESRIGKMPPVLVLHGRQDTRVPLGKYGEPLIALLRRRGAAVETRLNPQERHRYTEAGMVQVRAQVPEFFARKLR